MFIKLLKHEWRATRGTLGLLTLAAVAMGLFATVDIRIIINNAIYNDYSLFATGSELPPAVRTVMTLLLVACFIGLVAYFIAVAICLMSRFYKNKFTDEGYLTFTLPVKVRDIYLSSFVNIVIWLFIAVVVFIVLLFLFLLFGTATEGIVNPEVLDGVKEIFELPWHEVFSNKYATTTIILELVYMLISPIYMITLVLTCITAGAVIAKKHKILMAFAVYYGVNVGMSIFSSVLGTGSIMSVDTYFHYSLAYEEWVIGMVAQILMTAGLSALGYLVSTYLMKHKLNLP